MKINSAQWCAVLGMLACILSNEAKASQFAITTNNSAKLTFGGLFDGTNYLVPLEGDGLFNRANTNRQIAAQRVSQSGTLVGSLIDLGRNGSISNQSSTSIPRGAFDGTNCLVAWSDSANTGHDIYGQFMSTAGALVGAAFPIAAASTYQNFSGVVFDGTNYFVVWEDGRRGSPPYDVYGQQVSRSGSLVGGQIRISPADNSMSYGNIRLATHENGRLVSGATNYFVTFTSGNNSSGVLAQFVSPNGALVGSAITIKSDGIPISNPQIAGIGFDGTNYLVSWHKDVSSTEHDLLGQRVSRAGSLVGGVIPISTAPFTNASLPFLIFDGVNYLATWSDSFGSTNQTCRARFLDPTGNPVGPEFAPLAAQGTNAPLVAGSIYDGNKFFVAGLLGTFNNGDIYGRFIPKSTALPQLNTPAFTNGQFSLTLTGTPGINYAIQASTNLSSANWTSLATNSPTNGAFSFSDTHATNRSQFYRALKQ